MFGVMNIEYEFSTIDLLSSEFALSKISTEEYRLTDQEAPDEIGI